MSCGHPQWPEIMNIMTGIELATTRFDPQDVVGGGNRFEMKVAYNCLDGTICGRDGVKPSSFKRMTSGGQEVVFNDYAPAVFLEVREAFGISNASYLASLGVQQMKTALMFGCMSALFEMSSSGRSGSFFYQSHDMRYILKTIPAGEATTFRKMLPGYLAHVQAHPNTFVTRFTGLHAMLRGAVKMYFVVMANVFQDQVPIHETFDLKGSTVNRSTPLAQRGVGVALKDNDFDTRRLRVDRETKRAIMTQITADSLFLSGNNLNDYSFLLGIHRTDLALQKSDPAKTPRPAFSAFQQFHGGVGSAAKSEVYFMGLIDMLTSYNYKKIGEHLSKSVVYDSMQVSCVPPKDYHDRLVRYLDTIIVDADA
jgi:1-phosphatidylinositol-4-phosphate 5-kinase